MSARTPTGCITVLVPTLNRPASLRKALSSLFAQTRSDLIAEIIVVDNAPDQSARAVVEGFGSTPPIRYVWAQPPGVATARNAGLSVAKSAYVAFLDDDEEAPREWLDALFAVHRRVDADVTFGPVAGRVNEAPAWKRPYLEQFFSRTGPRVSGFTSKVYGCGNSLMTRATALAGDAPFDTEADASGGEDDRLFHTLRARGAVFAWAAEAVVFEYPASTRTTLAYAFVRAMAFGQGPSRGCIRAKDYLGVVGWMAVGIVQAGFFGGGALLGFLAVRPSALDLADKAMRGLGKVFWFVPLRFYGPAASDASVGVGVARRTQTATNRSQETSL